MSFAASILKSDLFHVACPLPYAACALYEKFLRCFNVPGMCAERLQILCIDGMCFDRLLQPCVQHCFCIWVDRLRVLSG